MSTEERDQLQLIDERDRAEEAISQAYYLVIGESPQWSNLFGYKEALEEIDAAQHTLRERVRVLEGLLKEISELPGFEPTEPYGMRVNAALSPKPERGGGE